MQFRKQGRRIQVLAYRGYSREKKRAVVKLLGSFDAYSLSVPDELTSSLSDDERSKLQSHIDSLRQTRTSSVQQFSLGNLPRHIKELSDSLTSGKLECHMNEQYASELHEAFASLTKALRKRGVKRPSMKPKSAEQAEPVLSDSQKESTLT